MRKRRAAMEMTLMSETGSFQSDPDQTIPRRNDQNQPVSLRGREESTVVEIIDEENTEIQLAALRMALNQCYEAVEMQPSSSSKARSIPDDLSKRIKDYRFQIRQTRKQRDMECITDRKVLKEILECWQEIKKLREEQGYVNTPSKLVIF
ncbi:Hypothetical predicted protein, partial [Paramuricea clavata]